MRRANSNPKKAVHVTGDASRKGTVLKGKGKKRGSKSDPSPHPNSIAAHAARGTSYVPYKAKKKRVGFFNGPKLSKDVTLVRWSRATHGVDGQSETALCGAVIDWDNLKTPTVRHCQGCVQVNQGRKRGSS